MSAQPNILLITTDQHNAEVLGCAGNAAVQTPHLDRLAAEGVLFTSAFTPHPTCTPARTSIFTGQTARRHGVPYNININEARPDPPHWVGLRAEATAFPEVLARQGYATGFFGKLHTKQVGGKRFGLQHLRLGEGKGQFVDHGSGPDDYRRHLREKGIPDSAWRTWEIPGYLDRGHVTHPLPEEETVDAWTATEAVEWLDGVRSPFFAWVSFSGPHTPWDPPRPYDTLYDPEAVPMPARRPGELEEKHPRWVDCLARSIPACPPRSLDPERPGGLECAYSRFPDEQVRRMRAAYYGEITQIDAQVGRVMECLEKRGLRENTLVLFTSDHGDYLGNNWAFFKYGGLYDSLARVPFLASWPGRTPAGTTCDALVSLVDIAPTFLEAAGAEPADPMDGRSLRPLWEGERAGLRDAVVTEGGESAAVVTEEWRYQRWRDGFDELYHRRDDPHDLRNLACQPGYAGLCRELNERLDRELVGAAG